MKVFSTLGTVKIQDSYVIIPMVYISVQERVKKYTALKLVKYANG